MNFLTHSELIGKHAILSPSNYHWINYDEDRLFKRYISSYSEIAGTVLHELACKLITHRIKLKESDRNLVLLYLLDNKVPRNVIDMDRVFPNLKAYVNDAIGFRMTPEVILYHSDSCFGTTDAIAFDSKNKFLRIHDLKTGISKASMDQLKIYAALFCLEYKEKPDKIQTELRIYQSNEVSIENPKPEEIDSIIDVILRFDPIIEHLRLGE